MRKVYNLAMQGFQAVFVMVAPITIGNSSPGRGAG